jgi:hypothetical protein
MYNYLVKWKNNNGYQAVSFLKRGGLRVVGLRAAPS